MSNVDTALAALSRLQTPIDGLAAITAIEDRRKEEQFIRYWQPTEKQSNIIKQWTSDYKVFGVLGGNRSGKTELGSFITIAWALGKEYFQDEPVWDYVKDLPIPSHPCNIWVVGLDYPTLRDVIWREKFRAGKSHPPFLPKDTSIVTKVSDSDMQIFIERPGGGQSVITGKSADSGRSKFQSASVDLVWIDEEPEQEIYDECYQRTADCAGKILITLTPLTDIASGVRTPWVFDLYEEMKAGKKDVNFVQLSVLDNPYVPEEEKDRLVDKWTGHYEERARLYGEFIQRSGLVYNMWKAEKHVVAPFRVRGDWRKVVVIDPAPTGVTAALWAAVAPNSDIYLYREYYESDKVISEHCKDILIRNATDSIDFWLIDPVFGAQRQAETHKTIEQLFKEGLKAPIRLAPRTPDFGLGESMEYMNATTDDSSKHAKVYVFSDLFNFIQEITHYSWAFYTKGEMKGLSKDRPQKRGDHLMNCFQYLASFRPRGRFIRQLSDAERKEEARRNSYT